jgi:hypothetical protein
MTLAEPLAVTFAVIEVLNSLGVRYFLGGSFASSAQGAARATLDADLVADLRLEHVEPFIAALRPAFYLDVDTVRSAVRTRESFNLIHLQTMFKVDVFVNKGRPFDRAQFERRQAIQLSVDPPRSAYLSSPEDTVLAKLAWYRLGGEVSDRQWRDVVSVLHVQADRLDHVYLRTWAKTLAVSDLLARALEQTA